MLLPVHVALLAVGCLLILAAILATIHDCWYGVFNRTSAFKAIHVLLGSALLVGWNWHVLTSDDEEAHNLDMAKLLMDLQERRSVAAPKISKPSAPPVEVVKPVCLTRRMPYADEEKWEPDVIRIGAAVVQERPWVTDVSCVPVAVPVGVPAIAPIFGSAFTPVFAVPFGVRPGGLRTRGIGGRGR